MSEPAAVDSWRSTVTAALRHRDFRTLWSATALASIAAWMLIVARGWLVFRLSDSSTWVGLVTFAQMAPFIFATPIGGALADRFDRRRLSAATHVLAASSALALGVLTLTGAVQPWHVAVLALASGIARAMEQPATQALIPGLVPRDDLLNAISLTSLAQHSSRLVGPFLAAPFITTVGTGGAFLLAGALSALAALQVSRVRVDDRAGTAAEHGMLRQFADGIHYVARTEVVLLIMVLVFFHCMLTMSFDSILPMFSHHVLGRGGTTYSGLVMAMGGGAFLGTLFLAGFRSDRHRFTTLLLTGAASGLTPILMAWSHALPVALLAMAGMGASQAAFMALTAAHLQSLVPDDVRGRVASLYFMLAGGVMSLAMLGNGRLADAIGTTPPLVLEGAGFLLLFGLILATRPVLRAVEAAEPARAA